MSPLFPLLCLYTTLYYIRPFEWVPGLMGLPLLMVAGILSVAALLMAAFSGHIRLLSHHTDGMVLGFAAAIALSHITNGWLGGAVASLGSFFPALVGYFLVVKCIRSERQFGYFVLLLVGLTAFLGYEAWRQYQTGFAHGGLEPFMQNRGSDAFGNAVVIRRVRWYGIFNDPNDLGLALAFVVPFLLENLVRRRWLIPTLALPPVLVGIFYTNSRGTLLALIAGLSFYSLVRLRNVKALWFAVALATLLVVFGPSRAGVMSSAEESAYGRIEAWHAGFQMFKSHPMFGVGMGSFTDYHSLTAHNSFVLVMAELGFLGLFCFIGLFYYPMAMLFRSLSQSRPIDGNTAAAYGSLFGLIVAIFFLSRAYVLLPYLGVACASVAASAGRDLLGTVPEPAARGRLALITFGVLVFINLVVKLTI